MVQRYCTKRIAVLRNLSYEERLARLDLDSQCRRLKADLTLYYKIMHGLTPWPIDRYFNMSVHSRQTRLTNALFYFCNIFIKPNSILIIFGTRILQ